VYAHKNETIDVITSKWRKRVSPKRRYIFTSLSGVTFQVIRIFV
jgi:hypothetical protein